jgi:aminopeptidase-like protein
MRFVPFGYDERQYCLPGLNLPRGCFMRTPHACFLEYHTSADDLVLITHAKCELQLRTRGFYQAMERGLGQISPLDLL